MSQKKQVLFINYSLHSGGIEKSLVTLLSLFDFTRYDVDLQLFANEGLFLERVPPQVNLLPPLFPAEYKLNIRKALFALVKSGHPLVAVCRLLVTFAGKTPGGMGDRLARMWKIEKHFVHPARKEYDAVVAFMEGQPIYYAVTKVQAKRKMMLDIEKECALTVASAVRNVPKKPEKAQDSLLEVLRGGG